MQTCSLDYIRGTKEIKNPNRKGITKTTVFYKKMMALIEKNDEKVAA